MSKKILPEHYFILNDGTVIKNLNQLSSSLKKMSDEIFVHHVTKDRNDFSNWIRDIIQDKDLAKKIKKEKDKMKMSSIINKKLSEAKKTKKETHVKKIKRAKKFKSTSKDNLLNKIVGAFQNA